MACILLRTQDEINADLQDNKTAAKGLENPIYKEV
jgi:hypothetical protein